MLLRVMNFHYSPSSTHVTRLGSPKLYGTCCCCCCCNMLHVLLLLQLLLLQICYAPPHTHTNACTHALCSPGHPVANDGTIELRPRERVLFGVATSSSHVGAEVQVEFEREGRRHTAGMRWVRASQPVAQTMHYCLLGFYSFKVLGF